MNIRYIFSLVASLLPVSQSIPETVSTDNMSDTCDILDQDKSDCGYIGIDQIECEQKLCCWTESEIPNIPWCFNKVNECYNPYEQIIEPVNSNEMKLINGYFDSNINIDGKGGVAVSPDSNTPGGSYYYHWARDSSLSMRSILESKDFMNYEHTLKSYPQWILNTHDDIQYNKIEPKFELAYGEVYTGSWCRHQNDGPGLQATSLIMFANSLIANNQSEWVRQYLWTGDVNNYHNGTIKYDLDWIVNRFNTDTCDLWEEITDSDFFWNRITMKKALILGYKFAMKMNDIESAYNYYKTMKEINETLYGTHWNEKFIQESGIMYGRYQGDIYTGGNPWILSSSASSILYNGLSDNKILPGNPIDLSKFFVTQADGVLLRLRAHIEANKFRMYEQIDKYTRQQTSTQDLSWSYVGIINAMNNIKLYVNHLNKIS